VDLLFNQFNLKQYNFNNMKTTIEITGQINSVYTLKNLFNKYESMKQNNYFNSITLNYSTKKQALQDIKQAKKQLKNEDQRFLGHAEILVFDAGKAQIYNSKIF